MGATGARFLAANAVARRAGRQNGKYRQSGIRAPRIVVSGWGNHLAVSSNLPQNGERGQSGAFHRHGISIFFLFSFAGNSSLKAWKGIRTYRRRLQARNSRPPPPAPTSTPGSSVGGQKNGGVR